MIFTLNEETNIESCLESVSWSDDIIVIDSGSSDRTRELCTGPTVRFFEHEFEGFGSQRNWAIRETSSKYDWILILDADERVPADLASEIETATRAAGPEIAAFKVRRRFYLWGRWLRYSNLYPTWVVRLINKDRVRYKNRGHAETQEVEGGVLSLKHDLIDENRKGIDAWFDRQNRYSSQDALYESEQSGQSTEFKHLFSADPLDRRAAFKQMTRKVPGRPVWYFLYSYMFRGGFLEGRDGLAYCTMRALYQGMITAKKHDLKRRRVNS